MNHGGCYIFLEGNTASKSKIQYFLKFLYFKFIFYHISKFFKRFCKKNYNQNVFLVNFKYVYIVLLFCKVMFEKLNARLF